MVRSVGAVPAARSLKVVPITAPVHSDGEIETAINAQGGEPGGGLVGMPDIFMTAHRASIISAAARNNVPAVYWLSAFPETAVCSPMDPTP
jgi:putative ABC transport system substrate-binding protein